jgi:putative DeoR family transcriptional regulator (stage III sporulation protein D)
MKEYIRKRVLDICNHILESKQTVRQSAIVFGVSKSTVHKDIPKLNGEKAGKIEGCEKDIGIF